MESETVCLKQATGSKEQETGTVSTREQATVTLNFLLRFKLRCRGYLPLNSNLKCWYYLLVVK